MNVIRVAAAIALISMISTPQSSAHANAIKPVQWILYGLPGEKLLRKWGLLPGKLSDGTMHSEDARERYWNRHDDAFRNRLERYDRGDRQPGEEPTYRDELSDPF